MGPAELELRTYCLVLDGYPECDRLDVRPTVSSGSQSVVGDSWIPAWFVCEEGQAPCSELASTGVRVDSEHLEAPVVVFVAWFEDEAYACASGPAPAPGCLV